MTNLLEETEYALAYSGFDMKDVVFIGSIDGVYSCTVDEFKKLADIEYDSGYGLQEVVPDLIILLSDRSYLVRKEYDGSEWWSHVPLLPLYPEGKPIESLLGYDKLSK
jgi:hypothetical protein